MPDINNIDYFNEVYVFGQPPATIMLAGSEKFGESKNPRMFTDQEKSDYIDELLERRERSGWNARKRPQIGADDYDDKAKGRP